MHGRPTHKRFNHYHNVISSIVSYNCRSISPQTRAKLRNHHLDERVSNWSQANVYNPIVKLLMNQVVWCSVWTVVGSARLLAWRVYPCLSHSLSLSLHPLNSSLSPQQTPQAIYTSTQSTVRTQWVAIRVLYWQVDDPATPLKWCFHNVSTHFENSQSRFVIDNSICQVKGCPISTQNLLR